MRFLLENIILFKVQYFQYLDIIKVTSITCVTLCRKPNPKFDLGPEMLLNLDAQDI